MCVCVCVNKFHKIFFTCRPCVMVSSEITSALASVLGLFSPLIDIWSSTRSTEVECTKEMKIVFHASQRATSFLCRTEAMTIPGKGLQGRMPKGIWIQCKTEDSKEKSRNRMERVCSSKKLPRNKSLI